MLIEAPADDCVGQPQQDKTMTSRKEREAGTTNTAFPEHTMRWILAKTVHPNTHPKIHPNTQGNLEL